MVHILVLQVVFAIKAGSKALGAHRAGQLGVGIENLVPMALPAARGQDTAVLGVLRCVLSATMHVPDLLL